MFSLCIISHGYPHKRNPISFPFVKQFAHAATRQGAKVTVIAPLAAQFTQGSGDPFYSREKAGDGVEVEVYRPIYVSASDIRIWKWNTAQIGLESFYWATRNVLKNHMKSKPDALYGHFLYQGGATVVRLGANMGIPSYPMVGEGMLNTVDPFGIERALRQFKTTTAFMANSSCLAELLMEKLDVPIEKIGVFPNGIDHTQFYARNKEKMREKLGLPKNLFIAICVGKQDLQKGPVRVGEAIRGLENTGGIFLGAGPNPPQSENILCNKPVPYDQVPEWLSAADVFVLPSTYEGCCNAALEAMSCGLPVVSSNGTFNDDILNPEVSIRTDPLDVEAIRQAIVRLRDDVNMRVRMGNAALKWSNNFDADIRARRILAFMRAQVQERGQVLS